MIIKFPQNANETYQLGHFNFKIQFAQLFLLGSSGLVKLFPLINCIFFLFLYLLFNLGKFFLTFYLLKKQRTIISRHIYALVLQNHFGNSFKKDLYTFNNWNLVMAKLKSLI